MNESFKSHFPIFDKYPSLAYLDNAATTQRPNEVIDSISKFYREENSNIHRGVYDLSNNATKRFEETREKIGAFLGAKAHNIAFTRGTTESINVVVNSFLQQRLQKGDNIVTTIMEHHANFIPWQQVSLQKDIELRTIPIDKDGNLEIEGLRHRIDSKTKLLSVVHISNTLGTINNINELIEIAHQNDVPVLIDAAQSAAYYELNHSLLEYDFLVFSGHKIFGPFGVGILFTCDKYVTEMAPYSVGGGIVKQVEVGSTEFSDYPHNLDAGTPNISGVIGLSSAIDFVQKINKRQAQEYLQNLLSYTKETLRKIDGIKLLGNPKEASTIVSFNVKDIHPHDVASFLNQDNIAVRAGMHCTQPLLEFLEVNSAVRVSLSLYNSKEEIDRLGESLKDLIKFWS